MTFIRLLWRMARRRWVRRLVFWLLVRLVRLFGWRRAVRLIFSGSGRWRVLAGGLWRAAARLLGTGRTLLFLAGWIRAHVLRPLGLGPAGGPGLLRPLGLGLGLGAPGPRRGGTLAKRRRDRRATGRWRELSRRARERVPAEWVDRGGELWRGGLAAAGSAAERRAGRGVGAGGSAGAPNPPAG